MIMPLIEILLTAYLIFFSVAVIYLVIHAVIGITGRKKYKKTDSIYSYLILVPAHNEEKGIARTIVSLKQLDQSDSSRIAVIADNCTDNTADVARQLGAKVFSRYHESEKGKGYALQFALEQSDLDDFDAVLIIDADTIVDKNALTSLTKSFASGYGAIQLNNCLAVKEDNSLSQLQYIANSSENHLFYKPRAILRLPLLLRGTGMAISSTVLQNHPWDSHSVTEDVDYAVDLLIKNISIDYIADSSVYSPANSSYEQSYTQKLRWASGTFNMIKTKFFRLIKEAFRQRRPELIELAFSILILSRPSMVYGLFPVILLVLVLPTTLMLPFLIWTALLILTIILYVLAGIFFVENKRKAAKAIFQIPAFAFWFFKVQLMALFKMNKSEWNRTERK